MKRAIAAFILLAAAASAQAETTMKITKDYNTLEVQDGATTYKIGVEQLKKMLRDKTKEAVKDGNADITGTVEIKEAQGYTGISTINGNGSPISRSWQYAN